MNTLLTNELSGVSKIDILKIDVEGGELKVLLGLDFSKYSPTIILVENICKKHDIRDFLLSKKYTLDKEIAYNQFYKFTG